MAKRSLYDVATSPGKKVRTEGTPIDHGILEFMSKKIRVRIHYQSGEVREHNVKVQMHFFELDDMAYIIVPESFYRVGKYWCVDYYYGNPRPIKYNYDSSGVIMPSLTLLKQLNDGSYVDEKGKPITPQNWASLSYDQKMQFPGVFEMDAKTINRAINVRSIEDLWGKPEFKLANKWVIFIAIILVAIGAVAWNLKRQGVW